MKKKLFIKPEEMIHKIANKGHIFYYFIICFEQTLFVQATLPESKILNLLLLLLKVQGLSSVTVPVYDQVQIS